jgi:hypothetical protein
MTFGLAAFTNQVDFLIELHPATAVWDPLILLRNVAFAEDSGCRRVGGNGIAPYGVVSHARCCKVTGWRHPQNYLAGNNFSFASCRSYDLAINTLVVPHLLPLLTFLLFFPIKSSYPTCYYHSKKMASTKVTS